MRRIFWGFCRTWVLIDPLHYLSSFEFTEIFVTEKQLPDSAFECLKENSASRHGESGSRYSNFLKFSIDFPDFKRLNQLFKRLI